MYGKRFGLAIVVLSSSLLAQQPQVTTTYRPAQPVNGAIAVAGTIPTQLPMLPQVAPLFIEDSTTSSSIVIVNNSAIKAGATICIRTLSGLEVTKAHRAVEPHEQLEVSIKSLLSEHDSPPTLGSVTVDQDPELRGSTVVSQLLITSQRGSSPTYADEELAMPAIEGSDRLRGVADQASGPALIAISSIVQWAQHVTLNCISATSELQSSPILVPPEATVLVSNCSGRTETSLSSYEKNVSEHPNDTSLGYELHSDGGPASFSAFGLAPHIRKGDIVYSAIPFADAVRINSANAEFAGVPFGPQPTLQDGIYSPRISLANFATRPAKVTVSIATTPTDWHYTPNATNTPEKRLIRQLIIPPRRSVDWSLEDAGSQAGLLQSVIVETDGKPGEVESKVVSRSDGTLYEIELMRKDQMDENNGGSHPWSTEDDTQSHLVLFNYSIKPRVFGIGISDGVIVWEKKYTLAPYETHEVNINELIADEIIDDRGQRLSEHRRHGVVNWMVPNSGEGTGRLMMTSHSRGFARNFSCGNFIVVCGAYFSTYNNGVVPINYQLALYTANPEFCDEWSPTQCVGGSTVGSGSASTSWSIGAASVVTGSPLSSDAPWIYGVGAGKGYASVTISGGGCSGYGDGAPEVLAITSVSPSTIMVGGPQVAVSITGTGFGSSASLNLPGGVTASGISVTDTKISVNLAASTSATVGYSNISVTNASGTSNQAKLTLDGPYQMYVIADATFTCLGCTSTKERDVQYQIKNLSGSLAAGASICEIPYVPASGWTCTNTPPFGLTIRGCSNPSATNGSGMFNDRWTLDKAGDGLLPKPCGYTTVNDKWYWTPRSSSSQDLGSLNGYVLTNSIKINNSVAPGSPGRMPLGSIVPF